jgi:Aldo/keto reductase family
MPAIGLGVFQTPPEETTAAVEAAVAAGYRHIDTAAAYLNEREAGEGIRRSGIDRSESRRTASARVKQPVADIKLYRLSEGRDPRTMTRVRLLACRTSVCTSVKPAAFRSSASWPAWSRVRPWAA